MTHPTTLLAPRWATHRLDARQHGRSGHAFHGMTTHQEEDLINHVKWQCIKAGVTDWQLVRLIDGEVVATGPERETARTAAISR